MTAGPVDVTTILVNYNTARLLQPSIAALRAAAQDCSLQVLVIARRARRLHRGGRAGSRAIAGV